MINSTVPWRMVSRSSNPTWILKSLCLLPPIAGGSRLVRLRPAVSRAQAAAALDVIFNSAATEAIPSRQGETAVVPSLELGRAGQGFGRLRHQFSAPLFILMGLVSLVLLIACASDRGFLNVPRYSHRCKITTNIPFPKTARLWLA